MLKAKSKATLMVADGAGGLVEVQDRRFEPAGDWPISFEMNGEHADTWLRYFNAECAKRGWSNSGIGQLEASENSGSITVNTGADRPTLAVVWERRRSKSLRVRARSGEAAEFLPAVAQEFFDRVNQRCESGAVERVYRRYWLEYEGLPWRRELWLDNTLRLSPPSHQGDTTLTGPRAVLVDSLVACVGSSEATFVFNRDLRELAAFLSVVMGTAVRVPPTKRAWTWAFTEDGVLDRAIRNLGYWEPERNNPKEMPERGTCRAMPLRPVTRPDFSHRGIDGSITEISLPADTADLWAAYRALTADKREQFLQAAAKWQEALTWHERSTLSFALMVVACEALKPAERQFKQHNIYDVVAALLGDATAQRLREHWFRPQDVRHAHLHRGEFRGSEFVLSAIMSSYQDPTFDQAWRALAPITQEAIIEWLRRGGIFTMPPIEERKMRRQGISTSLRRLAEKTRQIGAIVIGKVRDWQGMQSRPPVRRDGPGR